MKYKKAFYGPKTPAKICLSKEKDVIVEVHSIDPKEAFDEPLEVRVQGEFANKGYWLARRQLDWLIIEDELGELVLLPRKKGV